MRPKVIWGDFEAHLKSWFRSKGSVFWTIMFPILLMLIFGAMFSEEEDIRPTIHVLDLDGTQTSKAYINNLSEAVEIETIPTDKDVDKYIKDNSVKAALIIPEGFEQEVINASEDMNASVDLTLMLDPSQTSTNGVVRGVVAGTTQGWNIAITNASSVIGFKEDSLVSDDFTYIDFFMPGVIGLTVMTNAIYGTIFRNTKYRNDGILRKLTTTPLKRSEWLLAMMLYTTFMAFLSTFLILVVGILLFDINVIINPYMFIIIISASFAFAGMGMMVTRFVREEETADSAGGAITFPMMFLAGTFFPLEIMPGYLQTLAKVLPLYYVNEGLRDSMIYGEQVSVLYYTGVVFILALVFFLIGVLITKWGE